MATLLSGYVWLSTWFSSRMDLADRGEDGFTTAEWVVIVAAVVIMAAAATAAIAGKITQKIGGINL